MTAHKRFEKVCRTCLFFADKSLIMAAFSVRNGLYITVPATGGWIAALFFLFSVSLLPAQSNVTFEVATNAKEVVVGVPFELTFTLKNAEGTRFTPPNFAGFRNGGISEMRGMSIINGRSSSSQTWTQELTPINPGKFNIGAATVIAGGRTLSTRPVAINVLSVSASSRGNINVPPGADDQVFVAAEFDHKEAFVGQQVTWRVRLYTQLSVDGYDIIALPDFNSFFSKEKIRYDKRVEYLTIRGKRYAVRTLHELALFPQESGELSVGVARISVGIEQPGAQGFLFGPKPVTLQTQPLVLRVKDLQQPLPPEFTGGVGHYDWELHADTTVLSTDDALTLIVEVKGNGDTRRFAPPKITVPASCEIFEPRILEEEEYEAETEVLHRKKYEYVVLPKDTGTQEINPVLSYFDTDSNRYVQLRTATIRLAVSAGKNYRSPNALPELSAEEPTIAQQPGLLERLGLWLQSPWLWIIVALPFLVFGLFVLLKRRNAVLPGSSESPNLPNSPNLPALPTLPALPAEASAKAGQRFAATAQLLNTDDPHRFYAELFKALQAWLSARFGLQPAQMNDADVSALLLRRGATPIRIQALLSVWHTCEQSIYGGQAQAEQMESTWQMTGQVIEALERETR